MRTINDCELEVVKLRDKNRNLERRNADLKMKQKKIDMMIIPREEKIISLKKELTALKISIKNTPHILESNEIIDILERKLVYLKDENYNQAQYIEHLESLLKFFTSVDNLQNQPQKRL